ncbi:MAG TPA: LPS export ABC transporter permease LptG [bacterium]|jgi:lipopolysaccharide export system permease protein
MKQLDRYILRRFFEYFFFALLASVIIFVTVDSTENLDKFIDAKVKYYEIAYYYYLYLPYITYLTLPVSVLLATLFSIGGLVYRNELTAMQSAGYSLWRVLGLFLLVAVPLSGGMLAFGESVVPAANHERNDMYRVRVKKQQSSASTRQGKLFIQVSPSEYLKMEGYDPQTQTGDHVTMHQFENDRVLRRINADRIHYNGKSWVLYNVFTHDFGGQALAVAHKDSLVRADLHITPMDLSQVTIEPEEMNYKDLKAMVGRLEISGVKAGKWVVDLAFKLSQPFATVIIVLFGVPFAAFRRRGGLVLGFGLSLLVCFVYFGFMQIGKILGYNGTIHPLMAAWAGNIAFGLLGLGLIWRVPK